MNPYPIPYPTLAQSIADGEAVLILGPDALPLYPAGQAEEHATQEETTFGSLSRKRIRDSNDVQVNFFYERDHLFLFQDEASKNQARKVVRDLARDERWLPDEELLRQIIAMPFEVILNLSPDQRVREAFVRYGVEPQFDFCTPYRKEPGPTRRKPGARRRRARSQC